MAAGSRSALFLYGDSKLEEEDWVAEFQRFQTDLTANCDNVAEDVTDNVRSFFEEADVPEIIEIMDMFPETRFMATRGSMGLCENTLPQLPLERIHQRILLEPERLGDDLLRSIHLQNFPSRDSASMRMWLSAVASTPEEEAPLDTFVVILSAPTVHAKPTEKQLEALKAKSNRLSRVIDRLREACQILHVDEHFVVTSLLASAEKTWTNPKGLADALSSDCLLSLEKVDGISVSEQSVMSVVPYFMLRCRIPANFLLPLLDCAQQCIVALADDPRFVVQNPIVFKHDPVQDRLVEQAHAPRGLLSLERRLLNPWVAEREAKLTKLARKKAVSVVVYVVHEPDGSRVRAAQFKKEKDAKKKVMALDSQQKPYFFMPLSSARCHPEDFLLLEGAFHHHHTGNDDPESDNFDFPRRFVLDSVVDRAPEDDRRILLASEEGRTCVSWILDTGAPSRLSTLLLLTRCTGMLLKGARVR